MIFFTTWILHLIVLWWAHGALVQCSYRPPPFPAPNIHNHICISICNIICICICIYEYSVVTDCRPSHPIFIMSFDLRRFRSDRTTLCYNTRCASCGVKLLHTTVQYHTIELFQIRLRSATRCATIRTALHVVLNCYTQQFNTTCRADCDTRTVLHVVLNCYTHAVAHVVLHTANCILY